MFTGSVDRGWAKNQADSPSDNLIIKASRSTVRKCSKSAYVKSNDEYAQDESQIGMVEMQRGAACKGWMRQVGALLGQWGSTDHRSVCLCAHVY